MPTKLKRLVLKELSLVDRPANVDSVVTIFKRADKTVESIVKFCCDGSDYNGAKSFSDVLACTEARQKYWKAQEALYPLMDALSESVRSVVADAAMTTEGKEASIRSNVEAFMTKLRDSLPDAEEALTKFAEDIISGALTKEDTTMADKTELEKVQEQLDSVTKRAEMAELIAKASDAEKEFMKEMDDDKKKEFMALKPEDRTEKMRVAKAADEVLIVEGEEIRKSVVGAGMFAVIKSQQKRLDDQAADVRKAQEAAELSDLRKRADDEFANLPGTTDERALVLKAMGKMDEAVRKSLEAILKAGQAALKAGFTKAGSSHVPVAEPGSASEQLTTLAKKYAEEHKVSEAVAYDKVAQANPELYEQAINEGK